MRILITGATGFIGGALADRLARAGHAVIGTARDRARAFAARPDLEWIGADFNRDLDPEIWRQRFYRIDAVINCAGLWQERGGQTFEAVHALAPMALFDACARLGVKRVLHFSMASLDRPGAPPLMTSKRAAHLALAASPLDWTILAPNCIQGGRALSLLDLATAREDAGPPEAADARLLSVAIDEVCDTVERLLQPDAPVRCVVPLTGRTSRPQHPVMQSARAA